MASTYKPEAKPEVVAPPAAEERPVEAPSPAEPEKGALASEAPPPPEPKASPTSTDYLAVVEVALRVILFAGTLVAVVVMVTGSQTKWIPSFLPPYRQRNSAKFNYSPAFIYFVAAHSVACLYSIITTLLSGLALLKPGFSKQIVSHFVLIDVVLLGIIASATGAAGGVAYIGLRGNNHSRWSKICDIYGTFCQHLAGASAASLFSSVVLVLLILLSVFILSRKIPK